MLVTLKFASIFTVTCEPSAFCWNLGGDPDRPSFEDGTGHVIGSWVTDRPTDRPTDRAAGAADVVLYVHVDLLDDTLDKVTAHGAEIVKAPYPEGDLWVATFRDPAGNECGAWQRGPRRGA
jgi:uncharacterized protein